MTNNYISSSGKTISSVRKIAIALRFEHGIKVPYSAWDRPQKRVRNLIRYGSEKDFRSIGRELNTFHAIDMASDKFRAREAIDNQGIRVPHYSHDPNDLQFPIIGRPKRHYKCLNFHYYENREALERDYDLDRKIRDGFYFQERIPQKKEYRIHMFQGDPMRIQVKYRRTSFPDPIKRGMKFGWGFKIREYRSTSEILLDMCKNAMEAVSLDFGAIDAILGEDNKFYILEINTAPGLNDSGASLYANKIAGWINDGGI